MNILGGTVISSVASGTNNITLNHDAVSRTDVPTSQTPTAGTVIPIVTAISSTGEGHITAAAIDTITWPLSVNFGRIIICYHGRFFGCWVSRIYSKLISNYRDRNY